jgi:hypothetical protein
MEWWDVDEHRCSVAPLGGHRHIDVDIDHISM